MASRLRVLPRRGRRLSGRRLNRIGRWLERLRRPARHGGRLDNLSDVALRDIGLTRCDIDVVQSDPLWPFR